ncbi:MAG: hypothetical protein ACTH31_16875, partial [Pseudoclavibacter sp.]
MNATHLADQSAPDAGDASLAPAASGALQSDSPARDQAPPGASVGPRDAHAAQSEPATPRARVTLARATAAEWLKFATVPAYAITAICALALIVGLAAILVGVRETDAAAPAITDLPMTDLLAGLQWAQIVLAMLAVVLVCTEWSTGQSRVTFLAVPARWPVVIGKAAVVAPLTFVIGSVGAAGALAIGAVGGFDVGADPAFAARLVLASGLVPCVMATVALGISFLVRGLVAGMLTTIGVLWVLPLAISMVPWPELQRVIAYLP